MILHNEYLTDEELELLISEVEGDLVPAPPEMADRIANVLWKEVQVKENNEAEKTRSKTAQNKKTGKRREFAAYCFRVAMSVAAAITFMCILPNLQSFDENGVESEVQEYADKEAYLKENGSEPRQEVYTAYPTREEVLNDKSLMQRLMEGENIFDNNSEVPETPEPPDDSEIPQENIPTTGNSNINRTSYKYENGGQLL